MRAMLAAVVIAAVSACAAGQEETKPAVQRLVEALEKKSAAREVEERALAAFEAGEYAEAARLFEEQAGLDERNFVPRYNLACARARAGEMDAAWEALKEAVGTGFVDAHQLRRDEHLAGLRDDERFKALLANWARVVEGHREANVESTERWLGTRVERRTLEAMRIEVFSRHDAVLTDAAVREVERVAEFIEAMLGQGMAAQAADAWVMLALPDADRFGSWALTTFGPGAADSFGEIGGAYDHDSKRLVAKDLGATLRHEFVHALHWRMMSASGHVQPIWMQEGFAALVEDVDARGVMMVPVASWRTNIVKRLEANHRLPRIEDVAKLEHGRFTTFRPLRQYALARSVFMFVHEEGLLRAWFEAHARRGAADADGLGSLSEVFGASMEEINGRYREWVKRLPMVAETGEELEVSLGVSLETGAGDGPRVVGFDEPGVRTATGLRLGDVVTGIDGQSTRDLQEFIRVLSGASAGQRVVLTYRRGKLHGQSEVVLRARE